MVELVFLGLNDIGQRVYDWLTERDDATVQALLTEREQLDLVGALEPDLLVAGGFRHIVPEDVLEIPTLGAVNLHKSYLPYNRGANPNVWSIVEDNPAGVSIHYMTADIDEGPIVDRREVPVHPDDSGKELYRRLEDSQFEQFTEVWPDIRDGTVDTTEQSPDEGTYHYKQEFVDLWEIDREETVTAGQFLDRLRALTFPPFRNAYFEQDGERYHVELRVAKEGEQFDIDGGGVDVPSYGEGS
jgi:methionyl-tRNA formyltransferase